MPRVLVLSPATCVGSGPGSAGKRRQSASVASSSDEEDFSSSGPLSPTASTGPLSPNSSGPLSPDSCSSDYENVTSPNSSTASGPIYIRKPGFTNHAYSVISRPKIKKKRTLHDQNPSPSLVVTTSGVTVPTLNLDAIPRIETSFLAQKARAKRDPVPMRLRALPQSFWQQPNKPLQTMSSGPLFAPLPPLCTKDEMADIRPVTPPLETSDVVDRNGNVVLRHRRGERKITVGNTDLLFKLFENVEKKLGRKQTDESRADFEREYFVGRRPSHGRRHVGAVVPAADVGARPTIPERTFVVTRGDLARGRQKYNAPIAYRGTKLFANAVRVSDAYLNAFDVFPRKTGSKHR